LGGGESGGPYASYRANAQVGLGMVYVDARRIAEAVAQFEAALPVRERLARDSPEVTNYQNDLLVALGYLGQCYLATRPDQARPDRRRPEPQEPGRPAAPAAAALDFRHAGPHRLPGRPE